MKLYSAPSNDASVLLTDKKRNGQIMLVRKGGGFLSNVNNSFIPVVLGTGDYPYSDFELQGVKPLGYFRNSRGSGITPWYNRWEKRWCHSRQPRPDRYKNHRSQRISAQLAEGFWSDVLYYADLAQWRSWGIFDRGDLCPVDCGPFCDNCVMDEWGGGKNLPEEVEA